MTRLAITLGISLLAHACSARRVLVTGAGGRTGSLVFSKLNADYSSLDAVGLVRSKKAVKAMKKAGARPEQIVRGDTTDFDSLTSAMAGCQSVVLCTSAVPKIKPWSIAKLLFKKQILRSKEPGRPKFRFAPSGTPQEVDWLGAKLQIDAAKAAGVDHFVYIGSMGGTQPDNFLNAIGVLPDGSGGDILKWKRKAERYLMASGMDYTIIHPGGLVDTPPRERQLNADVDDKLLERKSRQVPRSDVARVACAAVAKPEIARRLSFDLASLPVGEGTVTEHAADVFAQLKGRSCKYEEPPPPDPPSLPALAAK